jgi:hypothetical protein
MPEIGLICANSVSEARVPRKANVSGLVSFRWWGGGERAGGRVDQVDDYRVPGADRGDGLLLTTHRPDSRSATRRIRSKSVADGVTLPEV